VIVLGQARYRGRGFTHDYDGSAPLDGLLEQALRGLPATFIERQDRCLHDLLVQRTIELSAEPLGGPPSPADADRLADALLARLPGGGGSTDWSGVAREMRRLQERLADELVGALVSQPCDARLVLTSREFAHLFEPLVEPHEIVTPDQIDDLPLREAGRCTCFIYLPEHSPRRVDEIARRLAGRGCAQTVDLPARLAHPRTGSNGCATPEHDKSLTAVARTVTALGAQSLLEYGCGEGDLLAALARALPDARLEGVERDDARARRAASRLAGRTSARVIVADAATGVPYESGRFDTIVVRGRSARGAEESWSDVAGEIIRLAPAAVVHLEDGDDSPTLAAIHRAWWEAFGPVQLSVQSIETGSSRGGRRLAAYRLSEPLLTVLRLHAVEEAPPGCDARTRRARFLPPRRLAVLLGDLKSRGYQFVSLAAAVELLHGGRPLPPRCMVVTFDRGYRSVFTEGLPILDRLNVPAAVFPIVSAVNGRIDGRFHVPAAAERPALTAGQLRELLARGWDVGSGTMTAASFAHLTPQQVKAELADGRAELEELLGAPVRFLSLPDDDADYCGQHIEQARAEGFDLVMTPREGFVGRLDRGAAWPRVGVGHDSAPRGFQNRLRALHWSGSCWPSSARVAAASAAPAAAAAEAGRLISAVPPTIQRAHEVALLTE
jgi:peptidoglycan/xylan/chitin deacetylase (PgdA/CDA1 family)